MTMTNKKDEFNCALALPLPEYKAEVTPLPEPMGHWSGNTWLQAFILHIAAAETVNFPTTSGEHDAEAQQLQAQFPFTLLLLLLLFVPVEEEEDEEGFTIIAVEERVLEELSGAVEEAISSHPVPVQPGLQMQTPVEPSHFPCAGFDNLPHDVGQDNPHVHLLVPKS